MDARRPAPEWIVAVNSSAGSADDRRVGLAVLRLAQHGPVQVIRIDEPWEAAAVAVLHPEAELIVVGGDGTISRCVDQLIHAGLDDRSVGLLPAGTGNDFAGALGVPDDPSDAADALINSRAERLSGFQVGDRFGVNVCHLGIGAVASRVASPWKDRIGPLAYPLGAALSGARRLGWTATIRCDGRLVFDGRMSMVAVALGNTVGGGTTIAPRRSPGSDAATVLIARGTGRAARTRLGLALLRGRPERSPVVEQLTASRIDVVADPPVPVDLDGDDLGDHRELSIDVIPCTWTALRPDGRR